MLPALHAAPAAPGAAQVVELKCDVPPHPAMEHEFASPGCWAHIGTHTYFLGTDRTWMLRGISGLVFSVEQLESFPYEGLTASTGDLPSHTSVHTGIAVETSLDGVEWEVVHYAPYHFETLYVAPDNLSLALTFVEGPDRQNVFVAFELAEPEEFRFLRFRQPRSGSAGLAGYLDFSRASVRLDPGAAAPPPALAPGALDLDCARHTMERIFAAHPCTFGGVNRYDTPSFFHTYFLGAARLDKVGVTFSALPWRLDDFRWPRALLSPQNLLQDIQVEVLLQASQDGVAWTTIAGGAARYGEPGTFTADGLGGLEAAFLRVVPEKHQGWSQHPALKHPRGFLAASALHVEGAVPG